MRAPEERTARSMLRRRIAEENPSPTVQMNTNVSASAHALREALAVRLGWTHRKVVETALELLETLLDEEESH